MKKLVALVMIAFLVPATATVAFAKNPCKEDKDKLCKDVKAAGKKVGDCLKEHSAELSADCKAHMAKPQEVRDREKAERKAKKGQTGEKPAEATPAEKPAGEAAPTPPPAPEGGENKQ